MVLTVCMLLTMAPAAFADEETEAPQEAPVIEGYSRVTVAKLEADRNYLMVTEDSKGNVYALYSSDAGAKVGPGSLGGDNGACTAILDLEGEAPTAKYLKDDSELQMSDLHFQAEAHGALYTFTSNGYYLEMSSVMFGNNFENALAVVRADKDGKFSMMTWYSRYLDFNCNGDDASGYPELITDFWGPANKQASKFPIYLYVEGEYTAPEPQLAAGAPESGTTEGQPFEAWTASSKQFRIPSLIALANGDLVASIDARWDTTGDGGGLDTITSISKDGGETWNYSFPNFFNDATNLWHGAATAFIDPVMVQGKDGTIYMMVDLFPGGIGLNSANAQPANSTGYVDVDGEQRLAIYDGNAEQTNENYGYYVGDFEDGYAPVISLEGETVAYVDDHYYLYDTDMEEMYCDQLGSIDYVHQNVFFYNADLRVRGTTFLWLLTSVDNGETWEAPMILNPMIRNDTHVNGEKPDQFYGVGPGSGLCLDDGTIMLPCYTFTTAANGGQGNAGQISSFIYSYDNGKTWARSEDATTHDHWSSESCLVQIDENTVRQFYRDGNDNLTYTDHIRDGEGWVAGEIVEVPDVKNSGNNQLSAIKYSEKINGKDAIILSTATGTWVGSNNNLARRYGTLYVLLINEDKTLALDSVYKVNDSVYGYSSLTELADGSIGLLYETDNTDIVYENFAIEDVANHNVSVHVPLYQTQTVYNVTATEEELAQIDSSIVEAAVVDGNLVFTGVKDGTTSFTCSNITYNITVAPKTMVEIGLKVGETKVIDVENGELTHEADASIAKAEIVEIDTDDNLHPALSVTGVSKGTTDVMVDGTVYRITVQAKSTGGSTGGGSTGGGSTGGNGGSKEPEVTKEPMPFKDVAENSWYHDAVAYAYDKGLMSGVSEDKFAPDLTTTRGMIVTILHALENKPTAEAASFTDVDKDMYCAKAVAWAASKGIVSGYSDDAFGPNDSITREQMAAILYSYAKFKGYDVAGRADLEKFADAGSISGYAKDAMSWAVAEGLISGMGDNALAPAGSATRAQVATILKAFLDAQAK